MKKIITIISLTFLITFLFNNKDAKAFLTPVPINDIEPIQNVLGVADSIVANIMTDVEKARKVQEKVSHETSGVVGPIKKNFNSFKKTANSIGEGGINLKVPDYLSSTINNPLKSKEVIAKEQVVKYGEGGDSGNYEASEAKNQVLLAEEVADLYATSLAMHNSLLQDKPATDNSKLDNRELIQATIDKAAEANVRLSRVLLIESNISSYRMRLRDSSIKDISGAEDPLEGAGHENSI